jgi:multisubunit Na+/H+ antiporter MnhF subunit
MDVFQALNYGVNSALVVALIASFFISRRRPIIKLRAFVLVIVIIQFLGTVSFAVLLWRDYAADPLKKYLLDPGNLFFIRHIQTEVTITVIGWLAALLLFWALYKIFIVRGQGQFIDGQDVALLILGAAAVGWPSIFIFLVAVFLLSVLAMVFLVLIRRKKSTDRLIITNYIIPAAVLVLVFREWLLIFTHLGKIGF